MADLLIELLGEEIPARLQKAANAQFKELWEKVLKSRQLTYDSLETYITPQRMIVEVCGLSEQTPLKEEEKRGPKIGAPEQAITGFLNSINKTKEECYEKNGYLCTTLTVTPSSVEDLIPTLLGEVIKSFHWEKTMTWPNVNDPDHPLKWIRPVRHLFCLWKDKPVVFYSKELDLTSQTFTYGNRWSSHVKIMPTNIPGYHRKLSEHFVIVNPAERENLIKEGFTKILVEKGLRLRCDLSLMDEVVGLIEYPFCFLGKIDEKFLKLPDFILSTSMKVHQKYFTVEDEKGKMAPFFGVVAAKLPPDQGEVMVKGFEKVLTARLSDAMFFYEQDSKHPLDHNSMKLFSMIFHEKLGSLGQKTERLELAVSSQDARRAALLSRADLLTQMVNEFPELQGKMGHHYAVCHNEKPNVAKALENFYMPTGADDVCPSDDLSIELALADKIDTLVGFFGINLGPTGTKDPFALRRAALGVVRILLEQEKQLIGPFIKLAFDAYLKQDILLDKNTPQLVFKFLIDRLSYWLKRKELAHDVIQSVLDNFLLNEQDFRENMTFSEAYARCEAIQKFTHSSDWKAFLSLYRRILNLVKNQSQHCAVGIAQNEQETLIINFINKTLEGNVEAKISQLMSIQNTVDSYLNDTMIHVEDELLKQHRIGMLQGLLVKFNQIANFSVMEGGEK